VSEEKLDQTVPAEDLLKMEGIDKELAFQLASKGVVTMEDLAELSVDELSEIAGLDPVKGGELIMTARAPWFEDEQLSE
jgi:N utilization substance protein A